MRHHIQTMLREAPPQIQRAVLLLWVSLGLSVLAAILDWEPLDAELREFEPVLWAIAIGCLVFAGALNYFVARRKNWARIVILVLTVGAIGGMLAFPGETSGESAWSIALSVIIAAMDLAAVFWLFTGSGSKWFSSAAV